jgi:hypothetical protein
MQLVQSTHNPVRIYLTKNAQTHDLGGATRHVREMLKLDNNYMGKEGNYLARSSSTTAAWHLR